MPHVFKVGESGKLRVIILIILGVLVLALLARNARKNRLPAVTSPSSNVPLAYKALYDGFAKGLVELNMELDKKPSINNTIIFGAEALMANGNRGSDLLKPRAIDSVILELDQFQKLGIQGVTIAIPYPLFVPSFPGNREYLNFYKQVAAEVKKRNLNLDVEMGAIFSKSDFSGLQVDYSRLTRAQYNSESRDMAQTIIIELSPDYLNLGSEPDTLASLIGLKELNNPKNYAAHVSYTLDGLKRGNTLVGAGGSSWLSIEFMRALAADTSVDFLSVHLYPLSKSTLDTITQTVELAKRYNKKVILDEGWLYKAAPNESATGVAATATIFKRDLYSFWQPLDEQFLSALVKIAKVSNIEYISPFWSRNFFTYIEYSETLDKRPYTEVLKTYNEQLIKDMTAGNFSKTGLFYKNLILQR